MIIGIGLGKDENKWRRRTKGKRWAKKGIGTDRTKWRTSSERARRREKKDENISGKKDYRRMEKRQETGVMRKIFFFLSSASCKGTNECKHEFRILKLKCIRRVLAHKWHDSSAPNSRIWNRVAVQIIRFDPLKRGIWYYKSVEVFNICLYF